MSHNKSSSNRYLCLICLSKVAANEKLSYFWDINNKMHSNSCHPLSIFNSGVHLNPFVPRVLLPPIKTYQQHVQGFYASYTLPLLLHTNPQPRTRVKMCIFKFYTISDACPPQLAISLTIHLSNGAWLCCCCWWFRSALLFFVHYYHRYNINSACLVGLHSENDYLSCHPAPFTIIHID